MGNMYSLADGVHVCEVRGTIVILHARHNAYYSFNDQQQRWFDEIRQDPQGELLSPRAAAFARWLVTKGILVSASAFAQGIRSNPMQAPHASLLADSPIPRKTPSLWDIVRFVYAVVSGWALWRLHRKRIHFILTVVARWKQCSQSAGPHTLDLVSQHALAFHDLSPGLLTTHDACFFRSLCLMRYLSLHHVPGTLVLGVRTAPFAAHCWVEYAGVVLNDDIDNVSTYTSILSV